MKEIWLAGNNPEEGVAIKSKLLESSLICEANSICLD